MLRSLVGSEMCIRDRMDVRDGSSSVSISQQSTFTYTGSTITVATVAALEPVVLCVSPNLAAVLPNVSAKMFAWSEAGKTDRWSTGTAIGVSFRNGATMNVTGTSQFTITDSKINIFGVDPVSYTHLTLPTKRIV
eukprot:TRINITY_DN64150_c0_g1_i1.p1 TRINITY_DN64150_c0_g1~~TRINITY_DN64150_c0_g1_i1.p1  ORF type:complete len:154 (-),score=39.80 TRINITY_DN64150_c0_g1_i1:57-461(-)